MGLSRVVVDGPSNLGLRAPVVGAVPGCYKLAGALRDCGLVGRVGAVDAGCVTPPRYDRHHRRWHVHCIRATHSRVSAAFPQCSQTTG